MPEPVPFEYAVVRVVPRVDRGEYVNAGIILLCRDRKFLDASVELDIQRLAALAPDLDPAPIRDQLDLLPRVCAGAGPVGRLSLVERFRWLASPRSTSIQVSPVHCGLCSDPAQMLEHLMGRLVRAD